MMDQIRFRRSACVARGLLVITTFAICLAAQSNRIEQTQIEQTQIEQTQKNGAFDSLSATRRQRARTTRQTKAKQPQSADKQLQEHLKDVPSFQAWMRSIHKAPFVGPPSNYLRVTSVAAPATQKLQSTHEGVLGNASFSGLTSEADDEISRAQVANRNMKVNTDLNPYPKVISGLAVDPTNDLNLVALASRFGIASPASTFYFSQTNGQRWSSDFVPIALGNVQQQVPVGISFNDSGHIYMAAQVFTGPAPNQSFSTTVAVADGQNHGTSAASFVSIADTKTCDPNSGCPELLQTQGVISDNSGTVSDGTTYVYYVLFCNQNSGCEKSNVPYGASVLVAARSSGAGQPYTSLGYVSGEQYLNVGSASGIVDAQGSPHFVYTDYTSAARIALAMDSKAPSLFFEDAGLHNVKWGEVAGYESATPNCASHGKKAFCVFNATRISGSAHTLSVYLAVIDLDTGAAKLTRVNNDGVTNGKEHFNPSVAVSPEGEIYVGWFDNRNDVSNLKLDYFVGKSTDGGKTFPQQAAVNDVPFDPTITYSSFPAAPSGKVAVRSDGRAYAVWTDTRDGATLQIWSEYIR